MRKFLYTIVCAFIISFFSVVLANGLNNYFFYDKNEKVNDAIENETESISDTANIDTSSNEGENCGVLAAISNEDAYCFYYEQLDETSKKVYDALYVAIANQNGDFEEYNLKNNEKKGLVLHFEITEDIIEYDKSTRELIGKIYTALRSDHRELFYLESLYATQLDENNKCVALEVLCAEEYRQEEVRNQIFAELRKIYDEVLSEVQGKNDYDTIEFITNYVIDKVDYCNICKEGGYHEYCHNIHGLLGKETVCEGYAATVDWLAKGAGLKQIYVVGNTDDGGEHAWNYINLNDSYYLLDVTWSDAGNASNYLYSYIGSEGFGQKYIPSNDWNYPELSVTGYYEEAIKVDKSEAYYEEYLYNLINVTVNYINMSQDNYELQENGYYEAERIVLVNKIPREIATKDFCQNVYFRYCNENPDKVKFLINGFLSLDDESYCKNILFCLKEEYAKAQNRK